MAFLATNSISCINYCRQTHDLPMHLKLLEGNESPSVDMPIANRCCRRLVGGQEGAGKRLEELFLSDLCYWWFAPTRIIRLRYALVI